MKNYRRYPEYKDSGIEWLGEIPAHWEVRRLKRLATINDEVLPETTNPDFEMFYVDIGSVDATDGIAHSETLVFANAPSRARRVVRHGDVIVSTVRTYLRAIAPIVHPEPNLIVSTGFAVIRPGARLATRFSAYALRSPYFVERVVANSVGVSYPAINASELGAFPIAVPPEDEQRAIADFLDRETGKIDALIEKKERLIELLKEKRTALISHAVTKGLDSNVPMKDSGIEWLGKIPAHWKIVRVKNVAEMRAGTAITSEAIQEIGAYPVYGGNGLRGYTSSFTHVGDVVLVGRQGALCGNVNYASGEFWASEHAVVVKPLLGSNVRWLGEVLRTMKLNNYSVAAAQPGLAIDRILALSIAVPPKDEQHRIADFLDRETGKIDALIGKIEKAIKLLKEYRTALISAAVTGKIDVRNGAEE